MLSLDFIVQSQSQLTNMNVWRKIDVNGENYLIKYFNKSSVFRIFISDLINLWYEEVDIPDLLNRTRVSFYY